MAKVKKTPVGEVITNKIKGCKKCNNGNCKNIQKRAVLNNFKDISYCGYNMNYVLQYTKFKEA
jgi:hypothetical protein